MAKSPALGAGHHTGSSPVIPTMEKIYFEKIVSESKSKSEVCRKLNISTNGAGYNKIDKLAIKFGVELNFRKQINHVVKYPKIFKKCPVCDIEFETKLGYRDEKTTCSKSCANSFFRSDVNNPNYKDIDDFDISSRTFSKKYQQVCFKFHEHKCIVCEEKLLLDVHHYDGNRKNNKPENLIPLCATHHNYWHSRYRYLIEEKVVNYVKNFKI